MTARERLLLIAILLLAALARFAALDRIPFGIYPDEALDGNAGYHAVTTAQPQLFYPENNGREGLFVNLTGVSMAVLGSTREGLRAVSALAGTLAVLLIFALARQWFSVRAGLFAAFLLATCFWHLNFSRLGFRAILVPTLLLAAVYGFTRGGKGWTALGGLSLGLGFHSYIAFRAVPLLAAAMVALDFRRKKWLLWLGVAALVAAPMAVYFFHHPDDFNRRADQVSVFATKSPLPTFVRNFYRSVRMFYTQGDCNPRHNLACQAELNLPAGLLLLIGLGCAFFATRRATHRIPAVTLLLWLPILLLPAALSDEGIPHSIRSIGALPAAILLAAWGADWLFEKLRHPAARVALVAIVAFYGAWDLYRYFGIWANSPTTREAFMAPVAELADYLNALPPATPRYVITNESSVTVPYNAPGEPGAPERYLSLELQPLILLTQQHPHAKYMRIQEFLTADFPSGNVVAPLLGDTRILDTLRARGVQFEEIRQGAVIAARIH